jgi:hypothetical protein
MYLRRFHVFFYEGTMNAEPSVDSRVSAQLSRRQWLVGLATSSVLPLAAGGLWYCLGAKKGTAGGWSPPIALSTVFPRVEFEVSEVLLETVGRQLWPAHGAGISAVIHALHAFRDRRGIGPSNKPAFEDLLAILLDHRAAAQWYDGRFSIVKTRYGYSYVTAEGGDIAAEGHQAQVLATLAELGVRTDQIVRVSSGDAAVSDFFGDLEANLQMAGEFEWSALTLALYCTRKTTFQNRFGESFDFNSVVAALLRRPFDLASCCGAHILYTVSALLQIDQDEGILSRTTRDIALDFIQNAVLLLSEMQLPDGSFDPLMRFALVSHASFRTTREKLGAIGEVVPRRLDPADIYRRRSSFRADPVQKILATAHYMEWVSLMDSQAQPEPRILQRAGEFLLKALESAEEDALRSNYCAYTHCFAVLVRLADSSGVATACGKPFHQMAQNRL